MGLCYFSDESTCSGPIQRAHWIKKERIKKALRFRDKATPREIEAVVWDQRAWDYCCHKHHHLMDFAKKLGPKSEADHPTKVKEYAAEIGFHYAGPEKGYVEGVR